ncbi:MAG: histidinol dehydrogenase, partial [Sphingomicrobium sp.]
MIERFDWSDRQKRAAALKRPTAREEPTLLTGVRTIVEDVRAGGWDALVHHAVRIDGAEPRPIAVAPFADQARRNFPAATLEAFALACRNIEAFHRATKPADIETEPMPGLRVGKRWTPIASAGLYVPGGAAPLFSTLLMLGIPARVAGVERLVVVTPPRQDGGLDRAIALAAEAVGVDEVWAVGGAQAIAALAFGAAAIPAMARICGPGNAWVTAAKALVASLSGGPAIDLPAGPSELMVIADASAKPPLVAADLLSQAEHAADAQVLLVSTDPALIDAVEVEVDRQISALASSRFAPVRALLCNSLEEAAQIANLYAPEHLSLALDGAEDLLPSIANAGAIFVGHGAAESFGDYLAGSSHVLPT